MTMKAWKLVLVAALAAWLLPWTALAYPALAHPVTDESHFLPADAVEDLAGRVVRHREATTVQIAVLVVPSTNGEPIEDFAHGTFEQWHGGLAGRDNGLLVVLAVRDHRSRVEVGRGLEAEVTDGEARLLLDAARPRLRESDYAGALRGIVDGLVRESGGTPAAATSAPGPRVRHAAAPDPAPADDTGWLVAGALLALALGVGGVLWLLMRSNEREHEAQRELDRFHPTPWRSATVRPMTPPPSYVPVPAPAPSPTAPSSASVGSPPSSGVGAGLAGAALGAAVGAMAASEFRRPEARVYRLGTDPKGGRRESAGRRDETMLGSDYSAYLDDAPTYRPATPAPAPVSTPRRADTPARPSRRADTPVSSPRSSESIFSSSDNSTDWGGGGGGGDGGGASSDW